ncbi:MAG: hypothetical protein ABIJ33_02170 [Patescibacteria group bacterium]
MPDLLDPALVKTFAKDKQYLEATQLPIITVSASFKEDVKGFHGLPEDETIQDVVFSRAHYSMAVGIATQAWGKTMDYKKAWIVDPTNYVAHKDWKSIQLTEIIGKTLARHRYLKLIKDFADKFGRNKLPILDSITPPLLHLTQHIKRPILSLHIATGNILAGLGKIVLQVITDPHVRYDYLTHAEKPNMYFCVFNDKTKQDLLEKATLIDKKVDPKRIFVTGPPVDPRIIQARQNKKAWRSGPLKLCITTGGLGTNKDEILELLTHLLPELRRRQPDYRLLIYAATHQDIVNEVTELAQKMRVKVSPITDQRAKLRIAYHPQIVDANELLIKYGFPWADGFMTKPSGDMAYDAVAAGCFLLTLQEWGEWEYVIREIFETKDISRTAVVDQIATQLAVLTNAEGKSQSWVELAMINAHKIDQIDKLFLHGAENIIQTYHSLEKNSLDILSFLSRNV